MLLYYYLIIGFVLFLGLVYLDSIGYLEEGSSVRILNPLKEREEFWDRFKKSFSFCFKNVYGYIFFIAFVLGWPIIVIMIGWGIAYGLVTDKKKKEDYEEE